MSVNIHGKEYITVAERIKEFRTNYPNFKMIDEVLDYNGTTITIKTSILNDKNEIVATGLAREDREDTKINETSYVENCETSAWGRALANLGIGVDSEIASAEEADNAIKQQEKNETEKQVVNVPMNLQDYDLSNMKDDTMRGKTQFRMLMNLVESLGQDKQELFDYIASKYNKKLIFLSVKEYLEVVKRVLDKNEPDDFPYSSIPF